jgi:hypothetical protein
MNVVSPESGSERVMATWQRDTTVKLNKRYIPSLYQQTAPASCVSDILLNGLRGSRETMKLFRTAFWLGVVIYNLPSPASQPAAPASQLHDGQRLAAKAANSRDAVKPSQDTLTSADRGAPWRGSARTRPVSKRPV